MVASATTGNPARPDATGDDPVQQLLARGQLWRGGAGGRATKLANHSPLATGWPDLDQLLGGGWPRGMLTELLATPPGSGELQLLLPALARLCQGSDGHPRPAIAWIAPPCTPLPQALRQAGIALQQLLLVQTSNDRETLWAMERALASGACGAVIGWLAGADARPWRRLQLAAEGSNALAVLLPGGAASHSPAGLRLAVSLVWQAPPRGQGETPLLPQIAVDLRKQRGTWRGSTQVRLAWQPPRQPVTP